MDLDELLRDVDRDEVLRLYGEAAEELLQVAKSDGHFADCDPSDITWPAAADLDALARRAALIGAIHAGIPPRRDKRLQEAYDRYEHIGPAYHRANRLYFAVRRLFVERGHGDERDFHELYQSVYLHALGRDNPFDLDEGEAALVQLRVARVPLSHAHSVAEKLQAGTAQAQKNPATATEDDPRLTEDYSCEIDGTQCAGTLRALLGQIAESVVDYLAAGEHLAIRFNTFSNFIWLGISVWKAITDAELLLAQIEGRVRAKWHRQLHKLVLLGKGMLLKFLQAHSEDPAQIRPREFWYGQEYSYLTRDMIDLTRALVRHVNRLANRARGTKPDPVILPPLLDRKAHGRFLEYPHVGRQQTLGPLRRRTRLLRWARLYHRTGRNKMNILAAGLPDEQRLAAASAESGNWGRESLEIFGIEVAVSADPHFAATARDLDLANRQAKVLFLPTHRSLFDHPVMASLLHNPRFLELLGWQKPPAPVILARARLTAPAAFKIAGRSFSLIGFSTEEVDKMLEEVDGHVIMTRSADTGSPTRRFAKLLEERPGVVYGEGTTASYEHQCLPMQHALFAHLPPDVIIVPLAFRGIHSLWPKCPRGNLDIGSGRVEVIICPPMPAETTLLPRKRALRTQLEPATLFQAVHIARLFNPDPT
ncbi:MAG: hypothetical protein VX293_06020 [Candidatus Latescibacterota bacterium]|nr:hypothetical protein [Candidatus Latescibacterota bacterium]